MTGKLKASDRRVLMTKWVGEAWDRCTTDPSTIIRAFKKCGISVPVDGSEDECININGLEGYQVYTNAVESTNELSSSE
jgi:hypothetical protein